MSEFYIRREGDEEAIGPYDLDQLSSLVDAKKLDGEAFYYDMEKEEWLKISSNDELMSTLYPSKRKLSLKQEAPPPTPATKASSKPSSDQADDTTESASVVDDLSNAGKETESPKLSTKKSKAEEKEKNLTVSEMLAAAEGRNMEESKGKTPTEIKAKAAYLCMQFCALFLFLSAAAMILIDLDTILAADAINILKSPFILFAAVDVLLGLFLGLQVTTLYPLIRFRAAIGFGFFTILFYAIEQPILILANALLMFSIYFATAVVQIKKAYILIVIGLAGILAYTFILISPLLSGA